MLLAEDAKGYAKLIAPRYTFGLLSNLRAPRRTSGLETIFPTSIIFSLTLLVSDALPSEAEGTSSQCR